MAYADTQLSSLTGLPCYEEHKIFGDKSGALIGIEDGYIVAVGLGKVDSKWRFQRASEPIGL